MDEGEKHETMSEGEKVKPCGMVEQLEQPQLVNFSFGEGGCLANKKEKRNINYVATWNQLCVKENSFLLGLGFNPNSLIQDEFRAMQNPKS